MLELQHKIFIIQSYYRTGQKLENGDWVYSTNQCLHDFRQQFPNLPVTYAQLQKHIQACVIKFGETGAITRKPGGGAPRKRTANCIEDIRRRMDNSPKKSIAKLSQVHLSVGTCHTILKKDLKLFPYKIQAVSELKQEDFGTRTQYCQWFLHYINNDNILDKCFFSDEAWFHLSGYLNKQNMRMWSAENPHEFIETSLHPQKIGVWLAVSRRRIIGPIFFNQTITAERYRNELLQPFINELHDDELTEGYFQQDNAPAHKSRETIAFLEQFFDTRIINFPPRSPDLTILDYFIFPYLKNTIFKTRHHTIEELRNAIMNSCADITQEILINGFESMKRRVQLCLQNNGQHFQHLL